MLKLYLPNAATLSQCNWPNSLTEPLLDLSLNYVNPCFLSSVISVTQVLCGFLVFYQTAGILFSNHYGPYRIKYSFGSPWNVKSVGIFHFLRFNCALLQAVLFGVLAAVNVAAGSPRVLPLAVLLFVSMFLVLPLHFLETTRSPVGHGSLIIYWFLSILCFIAVVSVDFLSPYKVFVPGEDGFLGTKVGPSSSTFGQFSSNTSQLILNFPLESFLQLSALAHAFEIAILINSILSYTMEVYFYTPSVEFSDYFELNSWDISSVKNLVSNLTFTSVEPVLNQVYHTSNIEVSEVPNPIIDLQSDVTIAAFKKSWAKELKRAQSLRDRRVKKIETPTDEQNAVKPSVFLTLLRVYYKVIFKGIIFELVDMACLTIAPFFLQKFIIYFTKVSEVGPEAEHPPIIIGVALAFSIYLCSVVRYFSFNQYFMAFILCAYSIKSSLTCLIYEKAMSLSPEARQEKNTGDIVNHVSVDVGDISMSIENCSDAITIPLRLALCLGALYKLLGNSMWAGLATALVLVPISTIVSTAIYALYNTQMKYKDERTRLTSEILNAIKSIKLYSWETPMLKKLDAVRNKKELVNAKKMGIYNAGSSFLWGCIPFVVSCSVYFAYSVIFGKPLVPDVVFPALSLFGLLAEPILMLPSIFSNIAEAKVALDRVSAFFSLDNRIEDSIDRSFSSVLPDESSVILKDATFVWSSRKDASEPLNQALTQIDFTARKGHLSCIVGRVGSGKTSLIKGILGEIPLVKLSKTTAKMTGSVAYCSQSPCIMNLSIRENILFGRKFNAGWYQKTVDACQLVSDFEVLPNGDATLVGEKGISLSGGQKARVSLARALYSRSDIYLLDDILSAVDAHVGKKITDRVLSSTGLLATKTIILATNSIKILRLSDNIAFLDKGKIVESGSFEELMKKNGEVSRLMNEKSSESEEGATGLESPKSLQNSTPEPLSADSSNSSDSDENRVTQLDDRTDHESSIPVSPHLNSTMADVEDVGELALSKIASYHTLGATSVVSYSHEYEFELEYTNRVKLHEDRETSKKGHVRWSVYLEFLQACNWIYIVIWCLFFWGVVSVNIFGNWILKSWSEKNLKEGANVNPAFYLGIYAFTGVAGALLTFTSAYIIWTFCAVRSSTHFHDRMAMSVLRSPMSFFDTTPIGRILNRFSDDISVLDQQILWSSITFVSFIIECVAKLSIVVYNLPFMFFVIAFLVVLYNYFRGRFMPAIRELKRIRSVLRSPVFSHLQESINGVETIRAYSELERFSFIIKERVDVVSKVDWTIQSCNRWLSMRLQSIAAVIVLASSLMIMLSLYFEKGLSPGMVGFLMTYVFSSTSTLNAIIRLWAEVETKAVNLERIIEYGNLPPEAELIIPENRPEETWPASGEIHFKNYTTRYRANLDPVLRNISLDIKPCEKIGIVGRTGAGKSSLTLALFRIIEATGGHIEIDLVDTSRIGLFDLRSQLNIIPQDAHCFEGSIRENLDPFEQYSDETLWKVLEMAHMKEHVESMTTQVKGDKDNDGEEATEQVGLSARVLEGGSNLSAGQKQLLSLARALLKESKVLVLDEATAAVDIQTDKIIQATIRSEFKDKTILTIAHRLDTIMDSDRVLVLSNGTVKEFDTPGNLLADERSEFFDLCKQGGYLDENGQPKSVEWSAREGNENENGE